MNYEGETTCAKLFDKEVAEEVIIMQKVLHIHNLGWSPCTLEDGRAGACNHRRHGGGICRDEAEVGVALLRYHPCVHRWEEGQKVEPSATDSLFKVRGGISSGQTRVEHKLVPEEESNRQREHWKWMLETTK